MNLWTEYEGIKHCLSFAVEPWRVVEDQYNSSSRDLVNSREEHDVLEALLEHSKPPLTHNKHYLITTPFRYPPLKYGSRFGTTYEPSLWYGSISLETAFAEAAFYRLQFFNDTSAHLEYIEIPMTAFKAYIETKKGIDLTNDPFKQHQDKISHKTNYEYSQLLGKEMREATIEAFIFISARDKTFGKNVAAFIPDVFKMKNKQYITNMQNWRCIANQQVIEFTRYNVLHKEQQQFSKEEFEYYLR